MEPIINFLSHPLVSGIIVVLISIPLNKFSYDWYVKSKQSKNIEAANNKMVSIVLDYILSYQDIEEIDNNIIEKIHTAVSIEYKVDEEKIYSVEELLAILVIETLEMKMLPSTQRKVIFKFILRQSNAKSFEERDISASKKPYYYTAKYRTILPIFVSLYVGLFFVVVMLYEPDIISINYLDDNYLFFVAIAIGLASALYIQMILMIYNSKKEQKKELEEKKERLNNKLDEIKSKYGEKDS